MQQAWRRVKESATNGSPTSSPLGSTAVQNQFSSYLEDEDAKAEPIQDIINNTNVNDNDKRSTPQDEAEAKHSFCSNCRLAKSFQELFVDGEGECENGVLILGQCPGQVEREQGVTTKLAVLTPSSFARHFAVPRKNRRLYIRQIVRTSKIVSGGSVASKLSPRVRV